jgi:hypothetical protein
MSVDGDAGADPFAHLAHEEFNGFGIARADRIHHHHFFRAGFESGEVERAKMVQRSASAVHGEKCHAHTVLVRQANGLRGAQ